MNSIISILLLISFMWSCVYGEIIYSTDLNSKINLSPNNCLSESFSLNSDNILIEFDLTMNSFTNNHDNQHIFDIGMDFIYLRYDENTNTFYLGIETQTFYATNRKFSTSDNGMNINHKIYITQNKLIWKMNDNIILHGIKLNHPVGSDNKICFFHSSDNGNNNDVDASSGFITNFQISSMCGTECNICSDADNYDGLLERNDLLQKQLLDQYNYYEQQLSSFKTTRYTLYIILMSLLIIVIVLLRINLCLFTKQKDLIRDKISSSTYGKLTQLNESDTTESEYDTTDF